MMRRPASEHASATEGRRLLSWLLAAALCAPVLAAGVATAQPCGVVDPELGDDKKAKKLKAHVLEGERLIKAGKVLLSDGKTQEARAMLTRALAELEAALPLQDCNPIVLRDQGNAHLALDDAAAAYEKYGRAASVKSSAENVPWRAAIDESALAKEKLQPLLQIELVSDAEERATVLLDGKPWNGAALRVEPGKHRVEISGDGFEPFSESRETPAGSGLTRIPLSTGAHELLAPPLAPGGEAATAFQSALSPSGGAGGAITPAVDWKRVHAGFDAFVRAHPRDRHALYNRARAALALLRPVEARRDLDEVGCKGDAAPLPWVRERAQRLGGEIDGAMGQIELELRAGGGAPGENDTRLLLDGKPLRKLACSGTTWAVFVPGDTPSDKGTPVRTGDRILAPPGDHVITATNPHFEPWTLTDEWKASNGAARRVTVDLPRPILRHLGQAALIASGSALVATGILIGFFTDALDKSRGFCSDKPCRDAQLVHQHDAGNYGTAAIAAGVSGAVVGLVGAAFVWQPWRASPRPASGNGSGAEPAAAPRVTFRVAPTGMSLNGEF